MFIKVERNSGSKLICRTEDIKRVLIESTDRNLFYHWILFKDGKQYKIKLSPEEFYDKYKDALNGVVV